MKTIYICEGCGKKHGDSEAAMTCESSHPEESDYELFKVCSPSKGYGYPGVALHLLIQVKGDLYRYELIGEANDWK